MNAIVPASAFAYNNTTISCRDEMVSLTDMWRAAGQDPQNAPAKWRALPGTSAFVEHVSDIVGKSDIFRSMRGRNGGTFAHWQIALAYAKYLSPEFHMWCNTVVRERMEGKTISVASIPPDILELIRRTDGISRMLSHKVTTIEQSLAMIASMIQPAHPVIIRHGVSAGQIWARHNLPKLKNASRWLGNRLAEMGASMDSKGEAAMRTFRLFDPDRAEACMKNGLLHKAKVYASERMGQGKLRLVKD